MSFSIQFIKSRGPYDLVSPAVNLIGNAALIGSISYLAFKTFKGDQWIPKAIIVVPVNTGMLGGLSTVTGGGFLYALIRSVRRFLGR